MAFDHQEPYIPSDHFQSAVIGTTGIETNKFTVYFFTANWLWFGRFTMWSDFCNDSHDHYTTQICGYTMLPVCSASCRLVYCIIYAIELEHQL